MSKHVSPGLRLLVLLTASSAQAQTPRIDHQPVACAAAEKFPRFEARFAQAETVATARVVFQGQSPEWYSVAMKSEGAAFVGVLPKPKKSLKSFRYFIEVTDKALGTDRTADYTTSVVDSSSACKGKVMAGALGSASVLLHGPAGVVALPPGFASSGVVVVGSATGSSAGAAGAAGSAAGGGGGLGTGAIVGIVAGAGAAAAGVAVAAGKSGDKGPSETSYTGPFNAPLSLTQNNTCFYTYVLSGTMTVTLEHSNGPATGQARASPTAALTSEAGGPSCNGGASLFPPTLSWGVCAITGTASNLACSTTSSITGVTFSFSGALSGDVISGMVTYTRMNQGPGPTDTINGTTTFPVTLR